jgi:excisionase family DNA binding protein
VRFSEAAKLLKCNEKTLRKHIAQGNLTFRNVGLGTRRLRREFALVDLVGFYAASSRRHGKDSDRGAVRTAAARGLASFTARRAERLRARADEDKADKGRKKR